MNSQMKKKRKEFLIKFLKHLDVEKKKNEIHN